MSTPGHCLHIQGLSHTYCTGSHGVPALSNINLSYAEPTFVCILGPSGCGKTTLLRIMAGLLSQTEGTVRIFGRPTDDLHPQGRMAYLSQQPSLLPWRTVSENVALPTTYRAQSERPNFDMKTLLRLLKIDAFWDSYPAQLSGGMKTRVGLARAWITHPDVLLLDEPFGALDPDTALSIGLELRRTRADLSTMIVMITHSAEQAALLADDIVVLSSRPAKVLTQLTNPLDRARDPRTLQSPQFFGFLNKIRQLQQPTEDGHA